MCLLFTQNKLHWHIYRLLRGRTVSGKLPKIQLFGLSLIHQLRLLGSQQHPEIGVHLTSFSAWGTENSLAEINLESTGGDNVLELYLDQILAKTSNILGGRLVV